MFIKFIRLYFYKVFVSIGNNFIKDEHSLIFTPKNRYFLFFFLSSIKYSFFIYPKQLIFISNKIFRKKYKKRIKKKILRQFTKVYNKSL